MSVIRVRKGAEGNQEKPPEVQLLFHAVDEKGQTTLRKGAG